MATDELRVVKNMPVTRLQCLPDVARLKGSARPFQDRDPPPRFAESSRLILKEERIKRLKD